MVPAHERLRGVRRALDERLLELVLERQLAAFDPAAKLAREDESIERGRLAAHRSAPELDPLGARLCRSAGRGYEHRLGAVPVRGVRGEAGERAHVERQLADVE